MVTKVAREMERAERARVRETERQQRENRALYFASKEAETAERNENLQKKIESYQNILVSRLGYDPTSQLRKLFKAVDQQDVDQNEYLKVPDEPLIQNFLPERPALLIRWIPGVTRSFMAKSAIATEAWPAPGSVDTRLS
jgi:hypothetical protein